MDINSLLPFLLTSDGLSAEFVHDDSSRKSCNKVRLDCPLGSIVVLKPGTASDTIDFVKNQRAFFLQVNKNKKQNYFNKVTAAA